MGRPRRKSPWQSSLAILVLALSGCAQGGRSPAQGEQRQARRQTALKPIDVAKKQAEKRAAEATYDGELKLLPSDEVVAGIRLPRGLETKLKVQNRHYFHTKVPLQKLREYFGPRLDTLTVVPDGPRTYKYVKAKTKDGDEPHVVNVRVGPSSATVHVNEILIQDFSMEPVRKVESYERSQAQLKALREHAQ